MSQVSTPLRNLCVGCGEDMGSTNPRQYCRKTYCPNVSDSPPALPLKRTRTEMGIDQDALSNLIEGDDPVIQDLDEKFIVAEIVERVRRISQTISDENFADMFRSFRLIYLAKHK